MSLEEHAQNRRVISGTLLRLVGSPVKSQRKVAQMERWLC